MRKGEREGGNAPGLVITLPGFWLLKKYEKGPPLPVFENAPQIDLYAPRLVGSVRGAALESGGP